MTTARREHERDGWQHYLRQRRLARECALQFLYQADLQDDWSCDQTRLTRLHAQVAELDAWPGDEQARDAWCFACRLIEGVCQERAGLDAKIGACAENWRLERMSTVDRNILRLALFELLHCDDVPDIAAIDEAIELAKEFGHQDSSRFVNGILDRVLQERQAGTPPGREHPGQVQDEAASETV